MPPGYLGVLDEQGANDVLSANDLTTFARDQGDPNTYKLLWSWDATDDWTGAGQSGNACALFDSDTDGTIDFALCAAVTNPSGDPSVVTQVVGSPYAFTCDDARNDRCGSPSPVTIPGGAVASGAVNPGTGILSASPPADLIAATDPFANLDPDQNWPNDATLGFAIAKTFMPPGSALINVCTYPSAITGGNNNPFDCVVAPGNGMLSVENLAVPPTALDFGFTVNPGMQSFVIAGNGSRGPFVMPVGTSASVAETPPLDWGLGSAACLFDDGTTTTGTRSAGTISGITVRAGFTTCRFTNRPEPPALTIAFDNDADRNGTFTDAEVIPADAGYPRSVTYRLGVANSPGGTPSTFTEITDDNVGPPLRSASTADIDCADLNATTINPGATVTCFYDATIAAAGTAPIVHTASVTASNTATSGTTTDTSSVAFATAAPASQDAPVTSGDGTPAVSLAAPPVASVPSLSGRSKLTGPTRCVKAPFKVRITGRRIARVKITIDRRPVKTFRASLGDGRLFVLKVNPARYGAGTHRLRAIVTYAKESRTAPRKLALGFRRCDR